MASGSNSEDSGQLPPAPHRPELGGNRYQGPFRTNQEYIARVQQSGSICDLLLALEECTEYGVDLVRDMEEQLYNLELFCPPSASGILQLEHSLLEVGGFPSLLQGLFYILPILHNGKLFVRYLETGAYKGFLSILMPLLKRHYKVVDGNILPWKIYTEKDIILEGARWSQSEEGPGYKSSTKYQRKVGSDNPKQCNKTCIMSQINQMEGKLKESGAIVFIQKARASATCHSHRFLYCSDLWQDEKSTIDEELGKYISHPIAVEESYTLLSHIEGYARQSMKEQFILLSSISNWHWYTKNTSRPHVRYGQHILYDPDAHVTRAGNCIRSHPPTSARNKLMYYVSMTDEQERPDTGTSLYNLVKQYLQVDNPDMVRDEENTEVFDPPPRKRRKVATRLLSVSRARVCESVGADLNTILNSANPNRTLYTKFQEELIAEGLLMWRYHQAGEDICVMTDINPSTGSLVPSSFVHVTYRKNSSGQILLKCSCAIYNLIKRAAHQDVDLWPAGEDSVQDEGYLDQELTCMHCRFFREYLIGAYDQVLNQHSTMSRVLSKVKESLKDMDTPVQVLGGVYPSGVTKFSIKGGDSYSVVHLNFIQEKCYAKCTEGMCAVKLQNKKKVSKSISLKERGKLCLHLQSLLENIEYVESLFPHYFQDAEELVEAGNIIVGPTEEMNNEDANIDASIQGNFNIETGLWDYKALSSHKPKEMMQPELIISTQRRNDFIKSNNFDPDTGLYGTYKLIPATVDATGRPKQCQCGAGYPMNAPGDLKGTANLYTRMGVIKCCYFNIHCNSGQCELSYESAAEEESIFFYSKQTCAGDEVGWDFIHRVMRSKTSFTAFCADMSRVYATNEVLAAPFMSYVTFVKWFFGWLAAFKIDFRREVDPWCQHNPKILACDGTHIGVSIRNMAMEKPVTRPDDDNTLTSIHRRYDRVLIQDRSAHRHIRYLTEKQLGKLKAGKELTNDEEGTKTIAMLNIVTQNCDRPVSEFILTYAQKTQHDEVIECMGKLLYMLSGDACMSSVAPFPSHDLIRYICINIGDWQRIQQPLEDLRRYNVEMSDLLKLSRRHGCSEMVTAFLDYLVEKIQDVHSNNRPAPQVSPIPNSYNPSSGTAYYFTDSGQQLRRMPDYKVSANGRLRNYDDPPLVEDPCRKLFPEVSFGGFGYLFLWFCPIHGHCYGMHLIAGGEGRKDPFASLYKYCEKAPDHIFYDFACQLNEYCLNREPEFFKNTRFWHDLFHSVGHLCGLNFKSGRVEGLEGINSEICEQVNSFLQCIKYTASHLTQDHFMFFLQFFLHLMNKEKTQRFRKLASIAVAGQL